MATIGLNFGSATSGAGFDVSSTVTSILAIESAVETPWKTHLASLQAQDSAFSVLGTNLSALSTALSSLTAFDGVTAGKEGSSSDPNTLALSSASSSAVAGSHTVVVTSLAATSSKFSDELASASDTLSGSVTLQIGSGSSHTLTLDSTNNTLAGLASAINSGGFGVSASVVTDTHGSRLSLVSKSSGAAGEISVTSNLEDSTTATSLGFSTGTTGVDARLTVDGLATTSASNTVTGAIPGVTFQLLQASANNTIQVQITNDNTSVVSAFQSLVTAYNAVNANIKTQEGKDATGAAQPLFGNPALALLQTQLGSALNVGSSSGAASGGIGNVSQLGLSVNQDGSLSLSTSTLQAALNSNFEGVTSFLQASGSFGLSFSNTLNSLSTTNTQGVLALALSENATSEQGITKDIATEDTRVASDKIRLTTELNLANQILQSIPSQLSEQDELYSAITGYNSK